ncbi:MAG: hypothetical protein ACODAE_05215 [Gemmatimonadota bacterium]
MGKDMTITGAAPQKLLDASTSTGPGAAVDLQGAYGQFGFQVETAGTTAAITAKATLEGTLDASTSASWTALSTWSSTGQSNGDTVFVTGKPVARVRANLSSISSTASTGSPTLTATAWVSAAP